MQKQSVSSGTIWEQRYSYCRAVRYGDRIFVSGTTASNPDGEVVGLGDPTKQTHFIFDKIEAALVELNSSLADVVRTRIFVADLDKWEPIAAVHGERFASINPANTLVQAKLIEDKFLVEIEVEAIVGAGHAL